MHTYCDISFWCFRLRKSGPTAISQWTNLYQLPSIGQWSSDRNANRLACQLAQWMHVIWTDSVPICSESIWMFSAWRRRNTAEIHRCRDSKGVAMDRRNPVRPYRKALFALANHRLSLHLWAEKKNFIFALNILGNSACYPNRHIIWYSIYIFNIYISTHFLIFTFLQFVDVRHAVCIHMQ